MEAIKQEAKRITEFLVANHEYLASEQVSPKSHVRKEADFLGSGRTAIRAHASVVFPASVVGFLSDPAFISEIETAVATISEATFDPQTGWFTFLKD